MLKDVKEKTTTKNQESTETVDQMIDRLTAKAHDALCAMDSFDQEKVDLIVHQMAIAGLDHHMELAKAAFDETGRGVMEDKAIKNMFATEEIWHTIKKDKTVGIIKDDRERN